jgi:AcrR family transcriptional regulator
MAVANKNRLERDKIIEVAAELFGEKGYSATSIRDISQSLKVSIATLYYYFKNKEDLLFTIIDSIGNDLLLMLKKAQAASDDPLEGLREMLSRHITMTEKKKNRVKVYVEEQHNLSKRFKKIIYKQHREIYDVYVNQLRELKRLGIVAPESLSVTAFAMFGMINWCYRWYRADGSLSIEDVAKRLIDLLFNGIMKPEAGDL